MSFCHSASISAIKIATTVATIVAFFLSLLHSFLGSKSLRDPWSLDIAENKSNPIHPLQLLCQSSCLARLPRFSPKLASSLLSPPKNSSMRRRFHAFDAPSTSSLKSPCIPCISNLPYIPMKERSAATNQEWRPDYQDQVVRVHTDSTLMGSFPCYPLFGHICNPSLFENSWVPQLSPEERNKSASPFVTSPIVDHLHLGRCKCGILLQNQNCPSHQHVLQIGRDLPNLRWEPSSSLVSSSWP